MLIEGSCHCGNISFGLEWNPDPREIVARACGCSFCTRHGGVWTSNPKGGLSVLLRDRALVSQYRFGTGTAAFHVCSTCGAVPVVTSDIDGQTYAVVNVNCFTNTGAVAISKAPADFDAEEEAQRLARRKRVWIGRVSFAQGESQPARQ